MTARSPTMVTLDDTRDLSSADGEMTVDCENCRHLTVVGLHDNGPRISWGTVVLALTRRFVMLPALGSRPQHAPSLEASFVGNQAIFAIACP